MARLQFWSFGEYRVCLGEMYEQQCYTEIFFFCPYFFDNLTNFQNQWNCGWISAKAVQIFPENFLDFRSDMIEPPKRWFQNHKNNRSITLTTIAAIMFRFSILSGQIYIYIYIWQDKTEDWVSHSQLSGVSLDLNLFHVL